MHTRSNTGAAPKHSLTEFLVQRQGEVRKQLKSEPYPRQSPQFVGELPAPCKFDQTETREVVLCLSGQLPHNCHVCDSMFETSVVRSASKQGLGRIPVHES